MNGLAMRKELHAMIDTMPDHFIQAMIPLVSYIADEYWKPVIETDLTEEERAIVVAGRKEREEHQENFTPWKKVRKGNPQ